VGWLWFAVGRRIGCWFGVAKHSLKFPAGIPRPGRVQQDAAHVNTGWQCACEQPPANNERKQDDSESVSNERPPG
jgi:hypothetical protein